MSGISILKKVAGRLGLGDKAADRLAQSGKNTDSYFRQKEDFEHLRSQVDQSLKEFNWDDKPDRVLAGVGVPAMIAQETLLLKAFHEAGCSPVLHIPYGSLIKSTYGLFGIKSFVHNDQLDSQIPSGLADEMMSSISTLDDVLKLQHLGVRVGKYALSSLMRRTRLGSFDTQSAEQRAQFKSLLEDSIAATSRNNALIEQVKPSYVLMVDRGYTPSGQLFDLCIQRGIPVITWNAAHKNNHYILKRYDQSNQGDHPCALSDQSWEAVRNMPWNQNTSDKVINELSACYQSGEWYGEVGTQFGTSLKKKDELLEQLELDPNKKTAIAFSHIFWDATFFWGEDLFDDYQVWFEETARAAIANDKLNWIFKVHPANLTKNKRDNVSSEPAELTVIRKATGGKLPDHIKVLDTDCGISTYSLFPIMDYCLTVRGTIGIESAAFGCTVLTAGTGRYDRKNFTHDFASKKQYLDTLFNLETIPRPSTYQIELAQRFAYATFLARPLKLKALEFEYLKTDDARLQVRVNISNHRDFATSPEVQDIKNWVKSGQKDFITIP